MLFMVMSIESYC